MFSYSKENYQQNKKQPTKWEKIFINDISDKELTYKIYKELIKLHIKKNQIEKNGQKT